MLQLTKLLHQPNLPAYLKPLIPLLQHILAGSRDLSSIDHAEFYFVDVAELKLLLEQLSLKEPV